MTPHIVVPSFHFFPRQPSQPEGEPAIPDFHADDQIEREDALDPNYSEREEEPIPVDTENEIPQADVEPQAEENAAAGNR